MKENIKAILQNFVNGNLSAAAAESTLKNLGNSGKKLYLKEKFFSDFDFSNTIRKQNEPSLKDIKNLQELLIEDFKLNIALVLKLKAEQIDIERSLIEYGMDSILINNFMNRIRSQYNISISPTTLLEFNNLKEFSNYLVNHYEDELIAYYKNVSCDRLYLRQVGIQSEDNKKIAVKPLRTKEKNNRLLMNQGQLHSLVISGVESKVEFLTTGEGPPVVLIGGIGASGWIWTKQLKGLSDYRVLIYYPPVHGATELKDENVSFTKIAEQLYRSLKIINITEAVHLIGWSLGGSIAQQFAITYPTQVKSLTLISSTATTVSGVEAFKKAASELKTLQYLIGDTEFYFPYFERAVNYYRKLLTEVDFSPYLSSICSPTLIITGDKDNYIDAVNSGFLKTAIVNSKYIEVKGAGHYPFLTHAARVNRQLFNFIDKFIKKE